MLIDRSCTEEYAANIDGKSRKIYFRLINEYLYPVGLNYLIFFAVIQIKFIVD